MMKRQLVITADGSPTLYIEEWQEHYHSMHGAVQESQHVFIQSGLIPCLQRNNSLHILEIGLGTGFNALITLNEALNRKATIHYYALEPFPVQSDLLQYFTAQHLALLEQGAEYFNALHQSAWEIPVELHPFFHLTKSTTPVQQFTFSPVFDLIYFDAFSPRVQPEMWTVDVFQRLFAVLKPGGIIVTYCAKGEVRRTLLSCGFQVERLPGPPGKREMLRATKI